MYIAHIREKDDAVQTVKQHCENTASLAAEFAADAGLASMAELAGLAHDFGKMCSDFTEYISGDKRFQRGEIDHSYAGAKFITELSMESGDKNVRWAARLAAHAIISHHGLHDWVTDDGEDYFSKRTNVDERYDEIHRAIEQEFSVEYINSLLIKAAAEYAVINDKLKNMIHSSVSTKEGAAEYSFWMGCVERFLESCLVDADRTDTADFMEGSERADNSIVPNLWSDMNRRMTERLSAFSGRTDHISVQRQSISDRCADFADHHVGAVRLIVPTGGGKTLASLRFAINYCEKFGMRKIIYTAPFMSILEQNSDEIKAVASEENFLEHHSNIFAELESAEEFSKQELLCERWTSPVIATTMVQFLNALFSGKMSALRRMHRLSKAVIIIDEIQSLPLKCVYMFNLAVNFLTKICGSAVVLCSATQPRLDNTAYPLSLDERASVTGDYSVDFELFRRTNAVAKLKNGGFTYEEAAEFCIDRFRANNNLLLIVNTKSAAAEMYRLLSILNAAEEAPAAMVHLSTNMCAAHRSREIENIRTLLKNNERVICVTTQLIEAGVDVSFNCVVRSLAGMDNAAQAAGRCNRHGKDECRDVYIIELGEEKLTRLKDISAAQDCSRRVIEAGKYTDILSPQALSDYFDIYYHDRTGDLPYPIKDGSTDGTLLDLLSMNAKRTEMQRLSKTPFNQAFASAGRLFEVIDNAAVDVLVPYNDEARELINDLNGTLSPEELRSKQRTAQKYTVSVYSGMKKQLEANDGIYQLSSGAVAATTGFYNENLGLVTEREYNDDLFF